jgi:type II secretory pathway pseudopilin PulG
MTDRTRSAFTAIELLVVLGIAMLLMAMAVPGLVGALRKSTVGDAASSITRVSSQARQLARSRLVATVGPKAMWYYGVVLVNDENPSYVALTFGASAKKTDILERSDGSGKPVCKLTFNRNITIMLDAEQMDKPEGLGWMYQYRTGKPVIANQLTAPNYNIGAPNTGTPAATEDISKTITVQTRDGRYRAAVAIYQIGLANIQEY